MHRASLRDLEQPCSLILRQVSGELETALDAIYVSLFRLAFSAINGVNPEVPQIDNDVFKSPSFASRIQRDRH